MSYVRAGASLPLALLVEGGVDRIEVAAIQALLNDAQPLAKALVMHDFPFPQEPDRLQYIRIIYTVAWKGVPEAAAGHSPVV